MERHVEDASNGELTRVREVLAKRTIAIYEQREGGDPVQRGSAILLRVADVGFVVSAGHVLTIESSAALLLAPMEGTSRFLSDIWKITLTKDQNSVDLGFMRLPSTVTATLLQQKEFIGLGDIVHQPLFRKDMYAVCGYPIAATRTDCLQRRVDVGVFCYMGAIQQPTEDYPEHCINLPCTTTAIAKIDSTGQSSVRMPVLKGISGCGVWQIDRTWQRLPLLAGIEHAVVERRRILGTIARFLPHMIAEQYSELRSSIRVTCPEV